MTTGRINQVTIQAGARRAPTFRPLRTGKGTRSQWQLTQRPTCKPSNTSVPTAERDQRPYLGPFSTAGTVNCRGRRGTSPRECFAESTQRCNPKQHILLHASGVGTKVHLPPKGEVMANTPPREPGNTTASKQTACGTLAKCSAEACHF